MCCAPHSAHLGMHSNFHGARELSIAGGMAGFLQQSDRNPTAIWSELESDRIVVGFRPDRLNWAEIRPRFRPQCIPTL